LWHDVSLIYLEDISDTSIGFESDEQGELLESSSERSASGSDIIKRKRLDLSLNRVFGNTNYVVNGFWERELFVSQGVEEASLGVSINVEYSLSRNVVSELRYSYQEDDFSDRADEGKDKRSSYTVGAQYNLSSSLSINSFIRFSSRYNKQNMTREYEEFTTGFGLNWSFLE
jgi:opacity protein-like surface antigen